MKQWLRQLPRIFGGTSHRETCNTLLFSLMFLFLKSMVWKSQFDFLTAIVTAPKPTDAEGKSGCWDSHTKQERGTSCAWHHPKRAAAGYSLSRCSWKAGRTRAAVSSGAVTRAFLIIASSYQLNCSWYELLCLMWGNGFVKNSGFEGAARNSITEFPKELIREQEREGFIIKIVVCGFYSSLFSICHHLLVKT